MKTFAKKQSFSPLLAGRKPGLLSHRSHPNLLNPHAPTLADLHTPLIQTKLTINEPGDMYEQEADRVAEDVMRMPAMSGVFVPAGDPPPIQKKCAACASGKGLCPNCAKEEDEKLQRKPLIPRISPILQRQTAEPGEDEDEDELLQRKEAPGDFSGNSVNLEARVKSLTDRGGQPLPESERNFFEPRFGHDFSKINIFHPELVTIQTKLKINQPGDKYERKADLVADEVIRMLESAVQRAPT